MLVHPSANTLQGSLSPRRVGSRRGRSCSPSVSCSPGSPLRAEFNQSFNSSAEKSQARSPRRPSTCSSLGTDFPPQPSPTLSPRISDSGLARGETPREPYWMEKVMRMLDEAIPVKKRTAELSAIVGPALTLPSIFVGGPPAHTPASPKLLPRTGRQSCSPQKLRQELTEGTVLEQTILPFLTTFTTNQLSSDTQTPFPAKQAAAKIVLEVRKVPTPAALCSCIELHFTSMHVRVLSINNPSPFLLERVSGL